MLEQQDILFSIIMEYYRPWAIGWIACMIEFAVVYESYPTESHGPYVGKQLTSIDSNLLLWLS